MALRKGDALIRMYFSNTDERWQLLSGEREEEEGKGRERKKRKVEIHELQTCTD